MWQTIKAKVVVIGTQFLAVLGFLLIPAVWYLSVRNKGLTETLDLEKAKDEMGEALGKVQQTQKEAENAEKDFNDSVADYKAKHPEPGSGS